MRLPLSKIRKKCSPVLSSPAPMIRLADVISCVAPGHHYHIDPKRSTRPQITPADASDIIGPLSKGRCYPKLRGTLLATVALLVQLFHGTASSPTTMGRVLVHLAMLSTASGWELPSLPREAEVCKPISPGDTCDDETGALAPFPLDTYTEHASTATDGDGGPRDRRRLLGGSCDSGWYGSPRLSFPPLRNPAAAFLPAATLQVQLVRAVSVTAAVPTEEPTME